MIVAHNLLAMNANRQLNITGKRKASVTEKLSSGYRINRAADDAAGLAISEKLRRQIRGLNQASQNVQDGISYVQVADGALNEVHDILHRMNELAVKSSNGTLEQEDRDYIDQEVQQLKSELDRIFDTTSFNERKIWEPDPDKLVPIAWEKKQAVTFKSTSNSPGVTNANCGVLAYGSYTIHADQSGVNVSWTGWDGNAYQTETVDWDTLEANNYSFEMSDYFGADDGTNKLYDAAGNPVFTHKVAFSVQETTTINDIITCIDGQTMYSSASAYMSGKFENADGSSASNAFSVGSVHLNYSAAYASNHNTGEASTSVNVRDFDASDDAFLEASDENGNVLTSSSAQGNVTGIPAAAENKDLAAARTSTEGWSMSFYMDGVGKVTANSVDVKYWAPSDTADDDEGYWWNWNYQYNSKGEVIRKTKGYITHDADEQANGSLSSVMAALTGAKDTDTPGLLTDTNGGDADGGGRIQMRFDLTSENSFTYGNGRTSNDVGYFYLTIAVQSTDTEQDVLDRISDALSSTTVFDLYSNSATSDSASIGSASARSHKIDVPIYGGGCEVIIQAGPESDDEIPIVYEALSNLYLGIADVNVKTPDDCAETMEAIKGAMQKVSKQRADFGAYQNRLEHTYNNNKNVEENTQYSESQIRDTDMALAMVQYAKDNLLEQAGQSMLAQANSSRQAVLSLLQSM